LLFIGVSWGLLMFVLRGVTRVEYVNRPESQFIKGGKNENYCYKYFDTFIEIDLDLESFNNYAKSNNLQFIPIEQDGFDILCHKFKSIHFSQKEDFNRSDEKWTIYEHHITNGFYHIHEDEVEHDSQWRMWTTVYDTTYCRLFRYRSSN
jgi:hypothetical protein